MLIGVNETPLTLKSPAVQRDRLQSHVYIRELLNKIFRSRVDLTTEIHQGANIGASSWLMEI